MRSASVRVLLAAAAALCLAGCSSKSSTTKPAPPPGPEANSPQNAVRLFERGWNEMDLVAFHDVLPGDFVFVFAPGDSAGNPFVADPIGRDDLLDILENLFVGGGPALPATSIHLVLDPTLHALPDSRPGKNPTWHKEIVSTVDLAITTYGGPEYRIRGTARFFVVRGDSAVIPADLAAAGVSPDSARWYIDRWDDETYGGGGVALGPGGQRAAPLGTDDPTWGRILALYYVAP
jgi:hypothetical protein